MNGPNTTDLSVSQTELKTLLSEASNALAHLAGDRLEEMASYCATLIGDDAARGLTQESLDAASREAWKEKAILMRVLEATRANLNVMRRLREIHMSWLEYGPSADDNGLSKESDHGDH
jgi:hypothetical protein